MALLKASKPDTLKTEDLRWKCDPSLFTFSSTKELDPIDRIIGQERALKALKLGVGLRAPGYNIYIAGLSGTGKATTVKKILESISSECPRLYDYAYVNNFDDPDYPVLLVFPQGKAKVFRSQLNDIIEYLKEGIPRAIESERHIEKKKVKYNKFKEKEKEMLAELEEKLSKENLTLGQVEVDGSQRPDILPIIDGKPVGIFQLEQLVQENKISKEEADAILEKYNAYQEDLIKFYKNGMKLNQELQHAMEEMDRKEVKLVVEHSFQELLEEYEQEKVRTYLKNIIESILENLQIFLAKDEEKQAVQKLMPVDPFQMYDVNIVLDNSQTEGCPVVVEISPTHPNLFGTIEKVSDGRGGFYADFTNIKAGSILKANGGFLVINANHVFETPGSWQALKRVLLYRQLDIQDSQYTFQLASTSMKPEPIDIDTKVILIGSSYIYSLLSNYEYDFKKIFKVKADFDYEVRRTDDIMKTFAGVIKQLIEKEGLPEFDSSGIAFLLEIAARYAGRKDKLTTRFSVLSDLAREAAYWAKEEGENTVTEKHVRTAYEAQRNRHGLYEQKLTEMITDEYILIDTDGEEVGQINGLAVYNSDVFSYGKPSRISASVSLGNGKIMNVEREAGLSGKSYDKGVLIITGYFKEAFGQELPLSFNANLVFEQSYGMIDGDSASAAELCVLFSALAEQPIKQSFAITGSVNQKGEIQAIGGVNEKIEGFFDICTAKGLNGKQGVIIPIQNVPDLMLKDEVLKAVEDGKFAIFPVSRIEQAIEITTGLRAGRRLKSGRYQKNTIYWLVEERLKKMYQIIRRKMKPPQPPAKQEPNKKSTSRGKK